MNWSLQQWQIFKWFANPTGNLVVRARAGTGKTTTIVEAVRHVEGTETRILVCAFNKRIQEELSIKLAGHADAKTLHALGFTFLRGAWGDLKVDADVEDERIDASLDKHELFQRPNWEVRSQIKKLIGIAKGAAPFATQEELAALAIAFDCEPDDPAYPASWMATVARNAMTLALAPDPQGRITFDDMVFIPAANGYYLPLYDWVIIDEAQDMNASQLLVAQAACKDDGHIVVVGDDRQAIYGWRGADSQAIDRLKVALNAEELGLHTTYRCAAAIVEEASKLVPDFLAAFNAPNGTVDECFSDDVTELVNPGDAILSRTNAPLVPLCLSLIRKGIPAKIEGRDIGKLLAARANKFKAKSVVEFNAKLASWAQRARGRALASAEKRFLTQKLADIKDMELTLEALAHGCITVNEIYTRCEQMFGDGEATTRRETVVLSTVHKAKGLEWNRVFLLEGTLYCNGRLTESIEEQNIHYVAVTRAKQTLVLVK